MYSHFVLKKALNSFKTLNKKQKIMGISGIIDIEIEDFSLSHNQSRYHMQT